MKRVFDLRKIEDYIEKYKLRDFMNKYMIEKIKLFSVDKKESVCSRGAKMEYMFFLVKGKLKINALHKNGRSLLLNFNKPLSIIGDMEFFIDNNAQCNVESVNNSLLIAIDMSYLKKYGKSDARFMEFIGRNLSYKLYNITISASTNLLYPVKNRVASYLLSIEEEMENNKLYPVNLMEIATLLGTGYRHLNRIIREFSNENIIEKRRNTIIIKDKIKLKKLAYENIYE